MSVLPVKFGLIMRLVIECRAIGERDARRSI